MKSVIIHKDVFAVLKDKIYCKCGYFRNEMLLGDKKNLKYVGNAWVHFLMFCKFMIAKFLNIQSMSIPTPKALIKQLGACSLRTVILYICDVPFNF